MRPVADNTTKFESREEWEYKWMGRSTAAVLGSAVAIPIVVLLLGRISPANVAFFVFLLVFAFVIILSTELRNDGND